MNYRLDTRPVVCHSVTRMKDECLGIRWVSANELVEANTREIADTFKSSHPKPRAWAMGFREDPRDEEEE